MSELVDRTIAALRSEHDALAALVGKLDADQLVGPSGASEWTVAQVLSHLGSGAEIMRTTIAGVVGESVSAEDNQAIWARWDAAGPAEQAARFVEHDTRLVEAIEALTPEQRSLTVDLGFLPEPVPVVAALGMRLNEVANHSWDVRAGLHPDAEVAAESAAVLVELFTGPIGYLLGFLAKPAQAPRPASVAVPAGGLVLGEAVTLVGAPESPSATFHGSPGAFVRLINGRLREPYAADATVEGDLTLDDLRRVFPGF
jgi:uncharacterized protein (TIGR03083 family)